MVGRTRKVPAATAQMAHNQGVSTCNALKYSSTNTQDSAEKANNWGSKLAETSGLRAKRWNKSKPALTAMPRTGSTLSTCTQRERKKFQRGTWKTKTSQPDMQQTKSKRTRK